MAPPGPLVYDVVFPINSSAHVARPEEGDIGTVTVRIELSAHDKAAWREIEELATPYARQRILTMVGPGGGIGSGKVAVVIANAETRPADAREIPEREGAFIWELAIQRI